MAFDYEGAINAGYTPSEIADFLGKSKKFDVSGARKAGYDDFEIISHLNTPVTTAPKTPQKEGFFPSLKEGAIGVTQATARGISAPFRSEEDIRAGYAEQQAAEEQRNVGFTPFGAIPEAYEKEGLGAAAKTTYKAARDALGRSIPYMAPTIGGAVAGSRVGALAAPFLGPAAPAGPIVGGLIGGIAGGVSQFAGSNIERRIQEETPGPLVTPEVYSTAAGQATLDTAATMFTLGTGLVAKVIGRPIAQVSEQQLLRTAERSLTGTLGRGAARGAASEMPTEVAQQILERKQAGLDLTSEDAYREYGEAAAAAGVLGGLFGGAGNVVTRGQARNTIDTQNQLRDAELAEIQSERDRIAGIARTAQQEAVARQQAEQEAEQVALAEQEKARQDYEASLRVPLTQQPELDLAPETTVEEVAAQRAAQSPQGDLFVPEGTAPVAPAEVTPTLDEDTIKSFGFKKNSLAYKAMEGLNNPAITPQEQVERFNTIIENNQSKIKTKEQEEAVTKFKQFMDQQLEKERTDELRTVDSGAVGESPDLFGGPDTTELPGRTGEPVGLGVDGVGTDVRATEIGADESAAPLEEEPFVPNEAWIQRAKAAENNFDTVQAQYNQVLSDPNATPEQIAEITTEFDNASIQLRRAQLAENPVEEPVTPRMTAEERQQRIIEQRAEEEAARREEKARNAERVKATQAKLAERDIVGKPINPLEAEGLQAALEAEETDPDVDMSQRVEQGEGTTPAQIEEALQDWYIDPNAGKQAAKIVNTVNELPPNIARVIGNKARERGIDKGAIQAFTHEGTAYLIADRIKPGTERSVFMHEVGAHLGLKQSEVNSIANKINKWANAAEGTIEKEVYNAVQQRMGSAKETSNEELVAYTVEEAANRGVTPQAVLRAKAAPPNTVAGIIRYIAENFMNASKAAFNAITSTPTAQDLIDYVYGSTRKTLQEGPAKVEAEPRLSATSTEPTGPTIYRDLMSSRVKDARLNLGAAISKITPKLLSMYQLVDQFGFSGNDGKFGKALTDYVNLNDRMTMEQQKLKQAAHAILIDWGQFAKQQDAMAKKLNTLMLDATRSRIHPDEAIDSEANAHLTSEDVAKYEELSNTYASLSPEAKQIYQRARQMLQDNFRLRSTRYRQMVQDSYKEELAEADEAGKQRIENKINKAIQEHELLLNEMRGPYFPLMRFGEYLVVAESNELRELRERLDELREGDLTEEEKEERKNIIGRMQQMEKSDEHYSVYAFEKRSEQAREAERLKRTGMNVRETKSEEYMSSTRASTFGAIDQLEKIFDREIDLGITKEQATKIRQAMIDSVLAGLPENSALQRQIKRRNIAGASDNMLRAFAESTERDSHYISRMGFMKPLSKSLIDMRNQSKNDMQLRNVYNNVRSRMNMDMKYDNHPILSKLTGISSIYHLGVAPSYLLQNMTQPFMITVPQLAGRYGAAKTSKAMIDAWKDSLKAVKGGRNGKFFSLTNTDLSNAFSGGELKMVQMLQDLGKLDIANNMDTEVYTKGMSPKMIKFWNMFNWSSHNIELMNRLSSALTAYRLEKGLGSSEEGAAKAARDAVELTQLDYSDTNASYFMKQGHMGGMNRIPMQFRKYQQGMIYLLARNFKNAWGGDKEAKKAFFYLMGTQLLMAGVRGVPVAAPLLFLMGAFGDDDDKEGDLETQLRNALADSVGPETARVFWKGLPAMMGLDSGSMSMENLFLPFPMMRSTAITDAATGKDAVTELMFNLGGAPVSMASRIGDAFILGSEGDYQKALEKALPKFMSSLVKAERLGSEGITTRSGNVAIEADEFDAWDQAIKALGFTPTKESEYYQAMYEKERISSAIDDRRNRIIKAIATARLKGEDTAEAREQAREFNIEHPSRRITGESITRSVAQRRKDKQQRNESGVRFEKRERDIRDVTRFAN